MKIVQKRHCVQLIQFIIRNDLIQLEVNSKMPNSSSDTSKVPLVKWI